MLTLAILTCIHRYGNRTKPLHLLQIIESGKGCHFVHTPGTLTFAQLYATHYFSEIVNGYPDILSKKPQIKLK